MHRMKRFSMFFAALLAFGANTPATATQSAHGKFVAQIDADCNAIQSAVIALKPIHVAYQSGKWTVISDADATAAVQTNAQPTFADVYKQGDNYAWVHAHSVNQQGAQRATQLCFRQSDGKVIQKTKLFEVNDPMIAKTIKELPFYAVLP